MNKNVGSGLYAARIQGIRSLSGFFLVGREKSEIFRYSQVEKVNILLFYLKIMLLHASKDY